MNKENSSSAFKSFKSTSSKIPLKIQGAGNAATKIDPKSTKTLKSYSSQPLQPYNRQAMQGKPIDLVEQTVTTAPAVPLVGLSSIQNKLNSPFKIADDALSPINSAGMLQRQFQQQKSSNQSQEPAEWASPTKKLNQSESMMDDGNSRRFSMFSKSSFATSSSFLFGTRIFNKTHGQSQSVPKVNISSIFKNKAYLYLDEALCNTFDDLLEKGHEIVTQKKEERDILKDHQEAMKAEAEQVEKEIVPLIQRSQQCSELIKRQNELQRQYEHEMVLLMEELQVLQSSIVERENEVTSQHSELTEQIKRMELNNNDIRSQINISKAQHRQEANAQNQNKKQKETQMNGLVEGLTLLKDEYEQKKMAQADRLRKMENKQKMYMGILKH